LPDGTIVSSMNHMLKNNTGYDVKQLFIGSEGTLGIITRMVLTLKERSLSVNTVFAAVGGWREVSAAPEAHGPALRWHAEFVRSDVG
jgi:FAD/FMN-containing dehydrogenase